MKVPQLRILDEILFLTGKAIFVSQNVENCISNLCRMFHTSTDVNPSSDSTLFGISRERTASLTRLKSALKELGINADHYLFPEIDDFVKRRDWVAHRSFIEIGKTRVSTREFQKASLNELIERALRLISVTLAVSQFVAAKNAGVKPLADSHIIKRLVGKHLAEAQLVLESMMVRKPVRQRPRFK